MYPEFINGPTNFAHLQGSINLIEKDIYIFFDKHFDLDEQTRCKSFDSVDISYYLYNVIKEIKEPLDFFMEIRETQINQQISNKKDIYINEVINLFKSEFVIDNLIDKDNVKYSKSNSNVRLHYIDIRDHLNIFYLTNITQKITKYIKLFSDDKINDKNIYVNKILYYIKKINDEIKLLDKNIEDVIQNKNVVYDKTNDKKKYYINKIINKYQNVNLGTSINFFLNIHFKALLNSINQSIIIIELIVKNYQYVMDINELEKNINELSKYIIQLYTFFTDAYLLRRVLDKNYVNKCIIYSGGAHSINYIFFLIKFCNFKIIKVHNSSEKNVSILTDKINKIFYAFDVYELFLLEKIYIQCIHFESIENHDTIGADLHKYMRSMKIKK